MVEGLTYIEGAPPPITPMVQFFALQFLKVHGVTALIAGWSSGSSSGS